MKAGAEIHFLAGQIFTLGIVAVAILPRMPSDNHKCITTIGGKLSYPFRRALLALVGIGIFRVIFCHVLSLPSSFHIILLDAILATTQVIGQSFLCLTTAYLLQCQLSTIINIDGGKPGRSLMPYLIAITVLTVLGTVLSKTTTITKFWCLINVAEAISVFPILKTLKTYADVTTTRTDGDNRSHNNIFHGPVLTQILMVMEYWYLITSIISFYGEITGGTSTGNSHEQLYDYNDNTKINTTTTTEISSITKQIGIFVQLVVQAIRQNQDNGIDDWMRLVLHSVFINSIDELQHFTTTTSPNTQEDNNFTSAGHEQQDSMNSNYTNYYHSSAMLVKARNRNVNSSMNDIV